MLAAARLSGSVRWFDVSRGFGFLVIDRDGDYLDIFFHISEWQHNDEPRAGDRVTFFVAAGRGGRPCAREVATTRPAACSD